MEVLFPAYATTAEEYRAQADEAEARAQNTYDPESKRFFQDIARRWREMAAQAEMVRLLERGRNFVFWAYAGPLLRGPPHSRKYERPRLGADGGAGEIERALGGDEQVEGLPRIRE